MTRETAPEAIDKLQRRKLELEVEIHALEREKDQASKDRLQVARKAIAQVGDELAPLVAAYENEKSRGDEVNRIRKKIDELKAKADEAERRYERSLLHMVQRRLMGCAFRYDQATASDLRYYALPDAQNRLESLLAKQAEKKRRALEVQTLSLQKRLRKLWPAGPLFLSPA